MKNCFTGRRAHAKLSHSSYFINRKLIGYFGYCTHASVFLNGGPTRSASLPDVLVHIRRRLFYEFRQRSGRELHLALLRDIFKTSRFVTLEFPLVENVQPRFCALGGV